MGRKLIAFIDPLKFNQLSGGGILMQRGYENKHGALVPPGDRPILACSSNSAWTSLSLNELSAKIKGAQLGEDWIVILPDEQIAGLRGQHQEITRQDFYLLHHSQTEKNGRGVFNELRKAASRRILDKREGSDKIYNDLADSVKIDKPEKETFDNLFSQFEAGKVSKYDFDRLDATLRLLQSCLDRSEICGLFSKTMRYDDDDNQVESINGESLYGAQFWKQATSVRIAEKGKQVPVMAYLCNKEDSGEVTSEKYVSALRILRNALFEFSCSN